MWLKSTHAGVFAFGKHKNAFDSEIYRDHPDYTVWACEAKVLSSALGDFQLYVRKRERTVSEDAASKLLPAAKRARGPPGIGQTDEFFLGLQDLLSTWFSSFANTSCVARSVLR